MLDALVGARRAAFAAAIGVVAGAALLPASPASAQQTGRPEIRIAADPTLTLFVSKVAGYAADVLGLPQPTVRDLETTPGIKAFCEGIGPVHPDIVMSSRRMTATELAECTYNGVWDVIELRLGSSGLVVTASADVPPTDIPVWAMFLAMAEKVPQDDKLVPNFYTRWNEIDGHLPATEIDILLPRTGTALREMVDGAVLASGCRKLKLYNDIYSAAKRYRSCIALRKDGLVTEAGTGEPITLRRLKDHQTDTIGLLPTGTFLTDPSKFTAFKLDGVAPTRLALQSGQYPLTIDYYAYVKRSHFWLVPGLYEAMLVLADEAVLGDGGLWEASGLVPLPPAERAQMRRDARNERLFSR
jgi:phosphate transport system substrate-binding protein